MKKICPNCYSRAMGWIGQFKGQPQKLSANICSNDEYNCYQLFCEYVHNNLVNCKAKSLTTKEIQDYINSTLTPSYFLTEEQINNFNKVLTESTIQKLKE